MKAWATLLTHPSYLIGVRTLHASLVKSGTAFGLIVMVTDQIDDLSRQTLEADGCTLYDVQPLHPPDDDQAKYANARFAEVWTKLTAWRLTEFERIVALDADMLVTQGMDELFSLQLADGAIAACHACRCNPKRIASYPASWTPENCHYTHCDTHCDRAIASGKPAAADDYLNGGLLVLTPDDMVFDDMMRRLAAVHDLSRYPFAEQDFLNEYYRGRWQPLAYVYNALKTLPFQHPALWDASAVKNIHYIIDKPWEKPPERGDRYYELTKLWWQVRDNV